MKFLGISLPNYLLKAKILNIKRDPHLFVLLGLMSLFYITGLIGINFGEHWDEYIHYHTVICSIKSGIMLPCSNVPELVTSYGNAYYNYPSFTFLLSLVSYTIGDFLKKALLNDPDPLTFDSFRLVTRSIFLVLSGCSGLWLYLYLVKISKFSAMFAASIYSSCLGSLLTIQDGSHLMQ